ncbi:DUF6625 family protein [Vibrio astriarenae]
MQKIAVVIPYFGKLPNYFNLYINSLKNTPYIDVLFFTDIVINEQLPSNFKVIPTTLPMLAERIENSLRIKTNINHPIKLCDFKPTWGEVFREELQSYSHWGFGDIDVVYGDIPQFLPDKWQDKDIISFLPYWLSGSLCIIKNSPKMRTLYQQSRFWQEALETSNHTAFDECHHLYSDLRNGKCIFELDDQQSFTWVVKKSHQNGDIDAYFSEPVIKEKIYVREFINVAPGKVTLNNGKEVAYYHLICEKNLMSFELIEGQVPETFIIDRQGFHYQTHFHRPGYRVVKSITGSGLFTVQQINRGIRKFKRTFNLA